MINLPKRSDPIYKEIEEFEDYELTNNIAYEMALRVNEVIEFVKKWKEDRRRWNNGEIEGREMRDFDDILYKHGFSSIFDILSKEKHNKYEISYETAKNKFYRIDNKFFLDEPDKILLTDISRDELKNYKKHFIKKTILMNFSRPKITLQEETFLDINLNVPKEELLKYIEKIKDNYDKNNSTLKTPMEFLGTELQEADNSKAQKKSKKKIWADAFFVYDYVEARLKQIENKNAITKQKYKQEIRAIKESKFYDSYDKKIQLVELAKEHNSNIINTGIKDIFNENELLKDINASSGTASNRYYLIKPYIDECRYKEFLLGVTNI